MSGAELGLAVSVFLACTVEAVEALTIVLAMGTTRSWSSAMSRRRRGDVCAGRDRGGSWAGAHLAADRRP